MSFIKITIGRAAVKKEIEAEKRKEYNNSYEEYKREAEKKATKITNAIQRCNEIIEDPLSFIFKEFMIALNDAKPTIGCPYSFVTHYSLSEGIEEFVEIMKHLQKQLKEGLEVEGFHGYTPKQIEAEIKELNHET